MTIEMEYVEYIRDYKDLREIFINISKSRITKNDLNTLKIYYADIINSSRVYDYINNIEELLRILEIRNALSYENIEVMKYIEKNFVKDSNLEIKIVDYERKNLLRITLPPCNYYDLPSGKYNDEETTRKICSTNFFENSYNNYDDTATNDNSIEENEIFLKNFLNFTNRERNIDSTIRKKFFCCFYFWAATVFFAILTSLLILLFTTNNLQSVISLASTEYNFTQNSNGAHNNIAQSSYHNGDNLHATMTLFTTQPAFQLTLPGSIRFSSTTQKSNEENNSEHMRIVLLNISEELGKHWRDVARFLKVKEYEIDELDSQNLPLKEKSFKALQIFQRKCDPLQWKTKLKRALDMARRRDLMELVDK